MKSSETEVKITKQCGGECNLPDPDFRGQPGLNSRVEQLVDPYQPMQIISYANWAFQRAFLALPVELLGIFLPKIPTTVDNDSYI